MKKLDKKEVLGALYKATIEISAKHHVYKTLFRSEDTIAILEKHGYGVFSVFQQSLENDLMSCIFRLLDPATMDGRDNLSFDYLKKIFQPSSIVKEKIDQLYEVKEELRLYRHRKLIHNDILTLLRPDEQENVLFKWTDVSKIVKISQFIINEISETEYKITKDFVPVNLNPECFLKDSEISILRDKLDSSKGIIESTNTDASIFLKNIESQYTNLLIHNYRKLRKVEIKQLSRVNLFVGDNNAGKTSVLESFYLLSRQNHLQSFIALERYRGRFIQEFQAKWLDKLVTEDIKLEGVFNQIETNLSIRKIETEEHIEKSHYINTIVAESTIADDELQSTIHLFDNKQPELYFQKNYFLCSANFSSPYRFDGDLLKKAHAKAIEDKYFDELVDFIRQKMDISIEKIELINIDDNSRFMVTSSNNDTALDLTKYGEGLQRVFEIMLLIGYSRDGILCIDELESAIHKNLLIDFTGFLQEAAERFNVQLFLSTHSKECIDAFVKNGYPDDELRVYSLKVAGEKITCKYLEGNRLRQLVKSINIDIR